MERRVLRKEGKGYIELPSEFLDIEQVELFPLKEGYYLLAVPLGQRMPKPAINELEKRLLQKLSNIKFYLRTVPQVDRLLGKEERETLQGLVKKEYVNVFQSKKYPEGVYNINDKVYPLLGGGKAVAMEAKPLAKAPAASAPPAPAVPPKPAAAAPSAGAVLSEGYAIFDDARAAGQISEQLRKLGKANSVKGIKGFDGKFYMVSKGYFSKAMPLLMAALEEGPKNADDLSKATKLPPAACLAMMRLLGEDGEVIEKKKGVFAKA